MKAKFFFNKYNLLMHLLFWGGYLSLSVFVFSGREDIQRALLISSILILPQIIIAYINMEYLIPRFFIKKKYLKYAGLVVLCFAGVYLFYEFILPLIFEQLGSPNHQGGRHWTRQNPEMGERRFFSQGRRMRMIYSFTQTLAIYFLSTAFKTSQIALKREKEAANLKSENLNSELKFLRSQINPHFLFNALNNIYSLSIIKSDKTPDNILKLSDMLRYIIYDCNANRVPLEKEINYINNYIDLQKLKDDQMTNIEVDFENTDPNCMIAPMIFIPFIENSFKHSKIEDLENGWIKMKIENKEDQLVFSIRNGLPKEEFTKDKVGGVGLENVRRRLELLYPAKHQLKIEDSESKFSVELEISLES
jgi:two-component system LytT family sensor kinase